MILTSDGGSLIIGSASDNTSFSDDKDIQVCKLQANGKLAWRRLIGSTKEDNANDVVQTRDGNYVIVGSGRNGRDKKKSLGYVDFWAIKLSATGELLWENSYGYEIQDEARCVVELSNGELLIGGTTYNLSSSASLGIYQGLLVRTDDQGNQLQKLDLDWPPYWLFLNSDNTVDLFIQEPKLIRLTRINNQLKILSNKSSPSSGRQIWSVIRTKDGSYMILTDGIELLKPSSGIDVELTRLTGELTTVWKKVYGGTGTDYGWKMAETNDGFIYIAGQTSSKDGDVKTNFGMSDVWLLKINSTGQILESKTYGGSESDEGLAGVPDGNEGVLIAGNTNSKDNHFKGWITTGTVGGLHGVALRVKTN